MTTMQRFKAYFGMVPPGDYEDDYLDEPGATRRDPYEREYRDEYYGRAPQRGFAGVDHGMREYEDEMAQYEGAAQFDQTYDHVPDYAYAGPVRAAQAHTSLAGDRGVPMERLGRSGRLEPLGARGGVSRASAGRVATRGALAIDTMDRVFEEGNPLAKITTLRPRDYSEARTIGERFRDGSPVIMDLVEMSNDDAKRLVDFAAGLAFALRGTFDKVATKVFLLSPADVDVSPEDRRKLAETGFYNHS